MGFQGGDVSTLKSFVQVTLGLPAEFNPAIYGQEQGLQAWPPISDFSKIGTQCAATISLEK
jgi:hypothetical protein